MRAFDHKTGGVLDERCRRGRNQESARTEHPRSERWVSPTLRRRPSVVPNRAHLFRRIAWRLQALAEGDHTQRARERALELAAHPDLRLRSPHSFRERLERTQEF